MEFTKGRGVNPNSRGPPKRNPELRVRVSGLPRTSWQDLKDFMRTAGDVGYSNVYPDGTGVVEFTTKAGFDEAMKKFVSKHLRMSVNARACAPAPPSRKILTPPCVHTTPHSSTTPHH